MTIFHNVPPKGELRHDQHEDFDFHDDFIDFCIFLVSSYSSDSTNLNQVLRIF